MERGGKEKTQLKMFPTPDYEVTELIRDVIV